MTTKEVNKKLKTALEWLKNDMSYKDPEQAGEMVKTRWIPHIEDVLKFIKE